MSRTVVASLFFALLGAAGVTQAGSVHRFQGGQTLSLSGLLSSESVSSHLALVNLAASGNRCTFALTGVDGGAIGPRITLTLKAGENRPFLNPFEHQVDPAILTEARATVSCERDFYAYALTNDSASGRLDVVDPVEESDSLAAPAKLAACPTGAVCFDAPGVVHVPAPPPGKPVGRVAFPAPAGVAKRLRLSLNVTVASWYKPEPSGKHLIYWFVVNKNIDMPGLLYFRGPGKDQAFARHGIGLTHPNKIKMILPFKALPGHTYHVDNDYDMVRRSYTVTVSDLAIGEVKVTLHSRPNVASYVIKAGSKFLVDMGFYPGLVDTEVPSYDWKYADVHVEAYL